MGAGAQATALVDIATEPLEVLASPGTEDAARAAAARCERAYRHLGRILGTRPDVRVLVLSPADWELHAAFPVYGMPHYTDERTLVVAGRDSEFWHAVVPPADRIDLAAAAALRDAYGEPPQLARFFDLLAVHELAHLFHVQAGREFPRLWLRELFVNLCLHAYVAEAEPESLPALETLPAVVTAGGHDHLEHHTLADFERLYSGVGAVNYGWYQCHFHTAAARIYAAGGTSALQRAWEVLPGTAEADLAGALERVSAELLATQQQWPGASRLGSQR